MLRGAVDEAALFREANKKEKFIFTVVVTVDIRTADWWRTLAAISTVRRT
jgi:hypothetical protein